ncbi:MAG TPA: hypothetical protein VG963_06290 [Polyangiaceae bacterium]|nr:hypothetical protein [Polyangiaceae bacterium]
MGTQKDGLVSRAVHEALGTLVSPQVYGQLVARALQASGLVEIPESGQAIAQWIEGALRREVEISVGVDAAELVAAQLAPIVAHASAAPVVMSRASATGREPVRQAPAHKAAAFASDLPTGVAVAPKPAREQLARTARLRLSPEQLQQLQAADRNTSRPQSSQSTEPGGELPRILAACTDAGAVESLRSQLRGTADVVQVTDLVGLLDALDEAVHVKPIVLLDTQRPTVHVTSVAAIGEDLPRGTTIVLWGASDEAWREIDRDRVPTCRWVRCSQEASPDDVGSLCAMLIRSG